MDSLTPPTQSIIDEVDTYSEASPSPFGLSNGNSIFALPYHGGLHYIYMILMTTMLVLLCALLILAGQGGQSFERSLGALAMCTDAARMATPGETSARIVT